MLFETFETLIARHGTDPARWPDPLLAEQEHVKAWLKAERELNAAMQAVPTAALSANFQDRVIEALPNTQSNRSGRRLRYGSLVAAALACVFAGTLFLQSPSEDEAWQEAAEDIGLGDIYEWVMDDDIA
jgi:ferric-dicitrate binding protein FerR (iron transport regulator)